MKIYIGIDQHDELIYLEWDKADNQERKTFTLSGGTYREPLTESQGEERAKEYLEDGELWKMAVESDSTTDSLNDWIDYVLSVDGWEHTLGDIENFGEHNNETIYLQLSSCGQHQEEIKNFKKMWVNEADLKEVYELWDNSHLKPLKETHIKTMDKFFEKYKAFCSNQEALNKYLEDIDY